MSTFEYTHKQIQLCESNAKHYQRIGSKLLTDFWENAAIGFQRRLSRMTLEEANTEKE